MHHQVPLENLNHAQLVQLQADAAAQISATRKQSIENARVEVVERLKGLALTVEDVFPGVKSVKIKSDKQERPITHRNPADHTQVYRAGGAGSKPSWLKRLLEQGVSLESMAV